jgi:2-amino-4-hydroxy-6-hydroxymethyldihydropteridine diphosphokinase
VTDSYIGLGANLGDRLATLAQALHMVDELPGTHVVRVSRVYETEPWGMPGQPDYANAAAALRTSLQADDLLQALQEIEETLGRVREERYGARTIDVDILLFGDEEWASPTLSVPHPRLLEREFVVAPLLEIAPGIRLPDGTPVVREAAVHGRIVRDLGVLPGFEDRSVGESDPGSDAASRVSRVPVEGQDWVAVASSAGAGLIDRAPDLRLLFFQSVLETEEIPFAYDPFAPTENFNPWGLTRPVRLLVPESYARQAKKLLADAAAAPPEFPRE